MRRRFFVLPRTSSLLLSSTDIRIFIRWQLQRRRVLAACILLDFYSILRCLSILAEVSELPGRTAFEIRINNFHIIQIVILTVIVVRPLRQKIHEIFSVKKIHSYVVRGEYPKGAVISKSKGQARTLPSGLSSAVFVFGCRRLRPCLGRSMNACHLGAVLHCQLLR